jgi:hypothetical protein
MTPTLIGLTFSVAAMSAAPFAAWPAAAPAPQASGACIAILVPTVEGVEGDATAVGSSVRELFASFLRGPSMQVVPLDARLTAHALEEAKQKSCGRVLTVSLTKKRGGNKMATIGRVAGQAGAAAASGMGYGASVGSAAARGAANAATQVVNEAARSTRAKDEVNIEFKILSATGKTEFGPKKDKQKAGVDGEDLLTPLVQRASEAIVTSIQK